MIISRSPLRITLGGGGTDLPSYYLEHGGFLIAAAIDKYVYITLHETFVSDLIVKYARSERVPSADKLAHPIIREAFDLLGLVGNGMELSSMADIPAGTGLGSSGSFTTALLTALHCYLGKPILPVEIAEQACHIEIDRLNEPIGKQDQYIAAVGGINCFYFTEEGKVDIVPLQIASGDFFDLEDNLMMFFTGFSRRASSILAEQDQGTKSGESSMIENLNFVKELGFRSKKALEEGNIEGFGELMHEHWCHKKERSGAMSNLEIDRWYEIAMNNGAIGGKLVGAGGGGFLLFLANDKKALRNAMTSEGLEEVRFRLGAEGTKIVNSGS